MRCPDCNKFVSFDEPEIEGDDPDIVGTAVSGNVRIVLKCADCGGELMDEVDVDQAVELWRAVRMVADKYAFDREYDGGREDC
jgi:hypothetical protein